MNYTISLILSSLIVLLLFGYGTADRLPPEVLENQIFSIDMNIEATGLLEDSSSLKWEIENKGPIPEGHLGYKQIIASSKFEDTIMTNGGSISENKNFEFDSNSKGRTRYNIENEKILTYSSESGAHLVGEEEFILSIAGNWNGDRDDIRCVFSDDPDESVPAFCNIVSSKSNLINLNTGKISTRGQLRGVGTSTVPSGLNYRIMVTPDENTGTGFAEGTVRTTFVGSIMEARNYDDFETASYRSEPYYYNSWNKTAAINRWKDETEITGGIDTFQKRFTYKSGKRL